MTEQVLIRLINEAASVARHAMGFGVLALWGLAVAGVFSTIAWLGWVDRRKFK